MITRIGLSGACVAALVTLAACSSSGSGAGGSTSAPAPSSQTSSSSAPNGVVSSSAGSQSGPVNNASGGAPTTISAGAGAPAACTKLAKDLTLFANSFSQSGQLTAARAAQLRSRTRALVTDSAGGPAALKSATASLNEDVDKLVTAVRSKQNKAALSLLPALKQPATQIAAICRIKQ